MVSISYAVTIEVNRGNIPEKYFPYFSSVTSDEKAKQEYFDTQGINNASQVGDSNVYIGTNNNGDDVLTIYPPIEKTGDFVADDQKNYEIYTKIQDRFPNKSEERVANLAESYIEATKKLNKGVGNGGILGDGSYTSSLNCSDGYELYTFTAMKPSNGICRNPISPRLRLCATESNGSYTVDPNSTNYKLYFNERALCKLRFRINKIDYN
ncbi:hypothetical protein fh0823_05920 [Francisella halioticida]|uniref:hypothetical protein n=1 Tax=Francisella halioticida TaxID=549298 RepID=UPI001AF934E2|nr:hypothetical protein [Francisella halioticida]BCD90453.1 hypothetical protein fh0823_05920 [Francisella halioticida]